MGAAKELEIKKLTKSVENCRTCTGFKAVISIEWQNGDVSVMVAEACFPTKEEAMKAAEKAEKEMPNLADILAAMEPVDLEKYKAMDEVLQDAKNGKTRVLH